MMKATVFDRAKTAIVLDYPFFASILFSYPLIESKTVTKTLAVSNRGRIYYNPDFTERLTVPQLIYGLCHEALHVSGQHAQRLHTRHHGKWNFATDAWINDTLDDARIGERIPNCVNLPGSKDRTCDAIYNELRDVLMGEGEEPGDDEGGGGGKPCDGPGGEGDDDGKGGGYMAGDGLGDDLVEEGPPLTDSEIKEMEAQAKVILAKAAQVAKARGRMPAALQRFVDAAIASRVPWYDKLERFMDALTRASYSWTRPNRRFIGQGMYLPSTGKQPSMGTLVVQKDISGSVSQPESRHFDGHMLRIMEECRPERVIILYTDSRVARSDEYGPDDDIEIGYWSGGGTDMRAGFKWCEDNDITPDVFVTLTDGETPYPEDVPYPTIWVISRKDTTSPIGETIHFDMEDA
jgi:predicted metal-dependent peptidase